MSGRGGRKRATLLVAVATAAACPTLAAARPREPIVIPAQPLSSALQALARRTGVNVLFLPGSVRGVESRAVVVGGSVEDAARAMVEDMPLRVFRDAAGGLIVQSYQPQPRRAVAAEPRPTQERPAMPRQPPPTVFALQPPPVLEELVVTSTRQSDTLNLVPLSVTAQTQSGLDQRGLRGVRDLEATAPALRVTNSAGAGAAIIAIRGIVQSGPTAATTGFYLDDVPLQRRSSGGAGGVNGTPLPSLFYLDRVEVLRGPQGTLFGGGSEGGTIRYIQPQPSLSRYSTYGRAQASTTRLGDPSYELGVAGGGPLVQDKLGFIASVFTRRVGGFIDLVDPFTGRVWKENANWAEQRSGRLALTWAPTSNMRATLSAVGADTRNGHTLDRMTLPTTQPIVVPTLCYDTRDIQSVQVSRSERTTPVPIGRGQAECALAASQGRVTHQTPGYTLGPYDLKPYQSIENDVTRAKSSFRVYSLDIDYDFGSFDGKSITSYIEDSPEQSNPQPFQVNRVALSVNYDPADPRNARIGDVVIPSGVPFIPFLGPQGFRGPAHFTSVNPRYSFTQELRFSSRSDARPLGWVAGVFVSNIRIKPDITLLSDSNDFSLAQFGITDVQRYGVRSLPSAPGLNNVFARIQETLKDSELSAFGELNYWPTDKLKLIAGVRVSSVRFDYQHAEIGPSIGSDVATVENGGAFVGSVSESPVTPRLGVQYIFNANSTVYVSVAKGYRAGGVNTPVAQAQAGDSLARNFGVGFTVLDLPRTYASDSVWSYELGGKVRLFDRLQLNGAIYTIDWKDTQTSTLIPQSGANVTTNAAGVRSQGFELEAEAVVVRGLTANAALGVTRANYVGRSVAFTGLNGVEAVSALAGQRLPLPPMTLSVGARYDLRLGGKVQAYVRADWRYSAAFRLAAFGATSWTPDSNQIPAISLTNIRAGVGLARGLEVNLFVNNLFERHKGPVTGGRSGCALPTNGGTPACANYTAYDAIRYTNWGAPREIGVQAIFRR